jgi:hypothetical protein
MLVRCRIAIEEREDPTVLDIMTDMRALDGIVTVRQTRPISDIVSSDKHRIIELNVSYIPKFVEAKGNIFLEVSKSLKKVEGVKIVKIMEHDNDIINSKLQNKPLIFQRKKMKLHDSTIAHIAKIIQMAILSGTDIVDHLRMARFTLDEEKILHIEEEYEKIFNESIEKMIQNIPETVSEEDSK